MQMVQQITLPKTEGFYTRPFTFEVSLVPGACRNYSEPGPPAQSLPLALDPAMQAMLANYGDSHQVSLDDIAGSALQFFRTSEGPTETLDYVELRFLLTYDFGRVLTSGSNGSIATRLGPASRRTSMRHGEAIKKTTEMFGYGLALHYVASVLGVPADWFTFILGSGARPDFWARRSVDELLKENPILETLGASGQRIYVEVKSRTGWNSMRERLDKDRLLLGCAKKAASCADGILLSIIIGLPDRSDSPRRTPRILVADPNSPKPLSQNEQAVFLLERYLFQAHRYGLEQFKSIILQWLSQLQANVAESQGSDLTSLENELPVAEDPKKYQQKRKIGERDFEGRVSYSLLERLGKQTERRLTVEEAHNAAEDGGDLGAKYFAGVDSGLMQIVERQDIQGLLAFGVRGKGQVYFPAQSAFRVQQLELDQDERAVIRKRLGQEIARWKETKIW